MFIDNYFDDEDIDVYEPDRESPEQILDNPLGAGNAANKSALDPRLYFLQLLQIRSRRVSQEWLNVAELLDARIKSAVSIVVHFDLNVAPSSCYGTVRLDTGHLL
jgi:hypothetical protein